MRILDRQWGLSPPTTPAELRAFREARGLTQKQLAIMLGISRRTMIRYETQDEPLPQMLTMACASLGDNEC